MDLRLRRGRAGLGELQVVGTVPGGATTDVGAPDARWEIEDKSLR